ncbi:hypothetical protein LZ32DRAFT_691930 [Colletotrichum eremochloae]|nr:hypothetical protein LZ32DRAFT_691930 [Colletotrichum eremochloae]
MSTTFHHDERRGITMPTERDSTNTREKRAWDSMKNHDDRTATLAKRTRLIASDLNKTDSPQHHTRIELSHEDYTVGWVCALPSEMAAAKAMLEAVHKPLSMNPSDTNQYVFGSIDHHNIVIVCLPSGQYGITRAAIVANNMRWSFPSISIRLMVGIGGGVPSKVDMRLGDVVVSCPTLSSPGVIQYDFGKTVNSGRFQVTGFLNKPPQDILGAVAKLRADHESQCSSIPLILSEMVRRNPTMSAYTYRGTEQDRLYAATYDHVGETCEHCDPTELVYRNARPDNNPRIHYGTVASANQVMKHGLTRDRLAKNYDILCFEMEAAGLMDHFPCLVIRGICDYSDSHKAKQWQEYAAATAAAYAKELLSVIPPVQGAQSSQSRSNAPEASSTSPEERRESLIQSLRFGQIDSRYESIKAAHSKTCHWLLGHSDYLCWLDPDKMAEHHGFLWISGKPGAGKSTIMKYVFSQAIKNATSESAVISFFFNARGDHLERTVEGMYRSLLLQLLEKFPVLQEVLDDVVPASIVQSSSGRFKVPMIQDLVLKTIAKLNRQAVTCFVDALDECDEQEVRDMLDFFVDLGHCAVQSDTKLYICFSSRHYPYMDIPHCQRFTLEDQTGHQEDIELYVNNKLQTGSKKQREDIKVQVLQKASGVFMWVVLVVDILNKEYKRGRIFAVKQRLSEIPPGLSELFRDILTRDQDNMDDFLLCIQWLLFGGRPLKREEYYFAMTAGLHPQVPIPWDTEEITTEDMNLFVLSSSKGLAETATKSKKSIVQFIHESVRDFLLKDGGLKSLWPDIESDFAENSHERLKRCCCTYLQADVSAFLAENDYLENNSSEKVASIRQEVGDKFPFMDYAATQLFYHAEAAACTIEQNGFLLDFSDRIFRSWIPRRNLFVPKNSRLVLKTSFLHFLVEQQYVSLIKTTIGSTSLCMDLSLDPLATKAKDNLLAKALRTGNEVAARAILQSLKGQYQNRQGGILPNDPRIARVFGPLINQPDKKRRMPFSYAAEQGLVDVAECLLELGGLIQSGADNPFHSATSPLLLAVQNGHGDIVKLLFSWNSRIPPSEDCVELQPSSAVAPGYPNSDIVSPTDKRETTNTLMALDSAKLLSDMRSDHVVITDAFWRAIRYKRDDIAIFLLNKGAKTDPALDPTGLEPVLHAAIHSGLESLTEKLLENGDDIKTIDTVDLLLKHGAIIDCKDNFGQTPLFYAAKWNSGTIFNLLLETGADIFGTDKSGQTLLFALSVTDYDFRPDPAYKGGKLLKRGLDPMHRDNSGQVFLHVACKSSHVGNCYLDFVREAIKFGLDVDAQDDSGRTPLMNAAKFGSRVFASFLLQLGVDANKADQAGCTPLTEAINSHGSWYSLSYGRQSRPGKTVVEMLLEYGANPHASTETKYNPLFVAVENPSTLAVEKLLDHGVDIGVTDAIGRSSLFFLPHSYEGSGEIRTDFSSSTRMVDCLMWLRGIH